MMTYFNRRAFLRSSAGCAAVALGSGFSGAPLGAGQFTGRIRKAVKYHMITEKLSAKDKLKMLKDLGFDGVEPKTMLDPQDRDQVKELRAASEMLDFPIHGVIHSSNPNLVGAIDQAKSYGANSVLHVVRYDKSIGYRQNYDQTQEIIRQAVDHAEKNEIYILLENVWASFLIEPISMVRYLDEIGSPFVQAYFDVGNVVRWGWPQHWLEMLGQRAKKLDIKEYDLDVAMQQGMREAFDKPLGEGSIEWDKVRAELVNINYRGWATAEVKGGDRARLKDISEQMDRVLDL